MLFLEDQDCWGLATAVWCNDACDRGNGAGGLSVRLLCLSDVELAASLLKMKIKF